MGSLSSTPKIANPTPQASNSTPVVVEKTEEGDAQTQEIESDERKKSLLARDRSRLGTISTTLQGVLGSVDEDTSRKTLLGE